MQDARDPLDLPPVIAIERRHLRDRRSFWRGGRRNTDWTSRPLGAWRHLERQFSTWHQWMAKLPLRGAAAHREARP